MTARHEALLWAVEDVTAVGINPAHNVELTRNLARLYVGLFF